jgi:hypothetical protein
MRARARAGTIARRAEKRGSPAMPPKSTIGVSIDFTFDSSAPGPPYWIQRATGTITYSDASSSDIKNWKPERLGVLDAKNGAAFTINLIDANGTTTAADIGWWAATFIPRSPTIELTEGR